MNVIYNVIHNVIHNVLQQKTDNSVILDHICTLSRLEPHDSMVPEKNTTQ